MTDLELKTYIGVDGAGPFMLLFGHIQDNVLFWGRLTPTGYQQGHGKGTAIDATHFTYSRLGASVFINGMIPGIVTFSISGDELTLTNNGITAIVKEQT